MSGSEPLNSPTENAARTERIRELNDRFRSTLTGGRVVITQGVEAHTGFSLSGLLFQIRLYERFDEKNDPYGEHDFGALEWDGETVFWKIDYYDSDLLMGSPDPADPAVTTRVLTIMLGWEY